MKTYSVKMNRCSCHPETCCCDDWVVVDSNGERFGTYFRETDAKETAVYLNRLEIENSKLRDAIRDIRP